MNNTNIPSIKEMKHWSPLLVMEFCKNGDYYTAGTTKEYDRMLDFVRNHEATKENLYIVARDIFEHSSEEIRSNVAIEDIMSLMMYRTVTWNYVI